MFSAMISCETNNRYEVRSGRGQRMYLAAEDTAVCTRLCCGSCRPFAMRICDLAGREVITLKRPLRCSSCCFPCCLQEVSKQLPGHSVKELSKKLYPVTELHNHMRFKEKQHTSY